LTSGKSRGRDWKLPFEQVKAHVIRFVPAAEVHLAVMQV
jgi:hypothetical protein